MVSKIGCGKRGNEVRRSKEGKRVGFTEQGDHILSNETRVIWKKVIKGKKSRGIKGRTGEGEKKENSQAQGLWKEGKGGGTGKKDSFWGGRKGGGESARKRGIRREG